MKHGEHALFKQVGGKGYYGKVGLTVELLDRPGLIIDFAPACTADWSVGVQFGIVYGWELFGRAYPEAKGLSVEVVEIEGKPVDTTNLVMAFVTASALWNALDWSPPKPPVLDAKTGCFTFSKY
jgi:hypothetical protein